MPDVVDHFYWAPQYIGLKSIPQRHWTIVGDTVSIPKDMISPKGPLYRRLRTGDEYWNYVRRQEETFNHIFDIIFAILKEGRGDRTIERLVDGLFSEIRQHPLSNVATSTNKK